ncbi:MAG: DPP IV N-terminal domain-containing protein [Gemmatimonadales bacterium]
MPRPLGVLLVIGAWSASPATSQSGQDPRESLFARLYDLGAMVRGGSVTPRWLADGSSFWYPDSAPARTVMWRVDPRSNTVTPFFDLQRLRRSVAAALGHEAPYQGVPFATFTVDRGARTARFALEGREWFLDLDTYQVTPAPTRTAIESDRVTPRRVRVGFPATAPDVFEIGDPTGRWFLTERGHDLWLRSTQDGREERLTTDGSDGHAWDMQGARWSPDGLRVAALKVDSRDAGRVPVVHWLKPVEEIEWQPFTRTGGRLPRPTAHLIDILAKRAVPIDLDPEAEPYLHLVGWTPDGKSLLMLAMDREYRQLRVLAVDATTGADRTVLTERSATFIRGIDIFPGWRDLATPVGDGRRMLFLSERDGWTHIYLYGLDGTLIRRLTSGAWPVVKIVAVDPARGWVYFTGHAEPRRYDTHLYRVNLYGSGFARLTAGDGQHSAVLSPSLEYFLDTHSTVARPPTVELRSTSGALLRTLSTGTIDELVALGWTPPEEVVVKAADDSTDLHGVLYKPLGFDPAKKYPVVEYIYGGPQGVITPRTFTAGGWQQALAAVGFVVWVVDGRGTPERGKAFQDYSYRRFGQHQIPEHAMALRRAAESRPYLDLNRVGLYGWSWGGYMTIRGLLLAPELYRVGVSIMPVVDLSDHMATPLEAYMGVPASNPQGYAEGSSLTRVGSLRGQLMLIHGTSDVNATFSATMKMVDALTRAGKEYDLVVVPELNHSLVGPARHYWMTRMWRYLANHLTP